MHKDIIESFFPYLYYSVRLEDASITVMEDMRGCWKPLTPELIRTNPGVVMGIVEQVAVLLKIGIGHCDLRFPNILVRDGFKSRLIDLESLTKHPPSGIRSAEFPAVENTYTMLDLAVWQLSLLLSEYTESRLFQLATEVSRGRHIPEDTDIVELVQQAINA
jgi:tRNA A-37 threonylcarbamoyl transferase component Bud32